MIKKSRFYLMLLLTLLGVSGAVAQDQVKTREAQEIEAYTYLNSFDYATAYKLFDKLNAKYPKERDYEEKLGICCVYFPEKKTRAIEIFQHLSEKYKNPYYDYLLGKAYQVNYRFDEALTVLEALVTKLSSSKKEADMAIVQDSQHGILNCKNGKMLTVNKVYADIKNVGAPVNSADLEYVPIITADESMIYFTYRGPKSVGGKQNFYQKPDADAGAVDGYFYGEDIYYSVKNADGTYGDPLPVESINTKGQESAIAISPDGQTMFTFNSSGSDSGDIFSAKLNGVKWETPVRLNNNINTNGYWEGSCSISGDGRFLYFASERPGGQGGRDIYVSEMVNGDWGPATNLGPTLNTNLDDDSPFIHPDGITLFFSSKGHLSIGGYDIMFSVKKDNVWTEPKSMGIPLNTTEDDNYYVINSKGDRGFFSSNRSGSGGLGDFDIYTVTPGILGEKPIIALVKGLVYGDDKPVEAKIEVVKTAQNLNIGPYFSNKASGKFLFALSPGSVYHVKVSCEGFETIEEDLDVGALNSYVEKSKDFYLYSPGMAKTKAQNNVVDSTKKENSAPSAVNNNTTEVDPTIKQTGTSKNDTEEPGEKIASDGPCSEKLPDFAPFKGKSLNNQEDYNQLLKVAGSYCAQNLVFKIQVGAYRNTVNFKSNSFSNLGKIEFETSPDGLTRFTQKQFKTLREAENHRQKLLKRGIKDAWIVVFSDGKRYTLEDLVMVDFLGKAVN
jgi:hypothetical protein